MEWYEKDQVKIRKENEKIRIFIYSLEESIVSIVEVEEGSIEYKKSIITCD